MTSPTSTPTAAAISAAAGASPALGLLRNAEHGLFAVLLIIGTVPAIAADAHAVLATVLAVLVAGWYLLGVRLQRARTPWLGRA